MSLLSRDISLAAIIVVLILTLPCFGHAQEAAKKDPNKKEATDKDDTLVLDEVVVRDTKPEIFSAGNVDVPRGINDVQPYYIFDSTTIAKSGYPNLEDFLKNRLSMNSAFQSWSATGTGVGMSSNITLRGLGGTSTLILVDGRRVPTSNYGGTNPLQANINGVPMAAIERIEVLPSSASAIYGGNAVAGVVNVILKKNYTGGEIRLTYDTPIGTDSPWRTVDLTYGIAANGGKTHVTLTGHYSDRDQLLAQDRPIFNPRFQDIYRRYKDFFNPVNSATRQQPPIGATPNVASTNPLPGGGFEPLTFKNGGASLGSSIATVKAGTFVTSPDVFIGGQYNLELPPTTQQLNGYLFPYGQGMHEKAFGASIRHKLMPKLDLFADFSSNSTNTENNKSPIEGVRYSVPATSPANPFNQNVVVAVPNPIFVVNTSHWATQSMVFGALADLPWEWKSEMDYTYTKNQNSYYQTDLDSAALTQARADGKFNFFVDTVKYPLTAYYIPYLVPYSWGGGSYLHDLALRASGPINLLLLNNKPTLTTGLEHRKEGNTKGHFSNIWPLTPASTVQTDFFPQSQTTDSLYAEANVPVIVPGQKLALAHSLDLQLAGRYEAFSVGSGTVSYSTYPFAPEKNGYSGPVVNSTAKYKSTNYTFGARYSPVESVAFRASVGSAFLPPSYFQLLPNPIPSSPSLSFINDPKTGTSYSGYTTVQVANRDLQPQTSKTTNLGVVFEPKADLLKGLRFDLEYFKIKQKGVITGPPGGVQFIINNESTYPGRVTRDPATGLITQVDTGSVNLFSMETTGWDISMNYRKDTLLGNFDLYAVATVTETFKQQIALDKPMLSYLGFPGTGFGGGPLKTRGNGTLTWSRGSWTVAWSATYFHSYYEFGAPGDPQYGGNPAATLNTKYTTAQGGNTVSSYIPQDVMISWASSGNQRNSRISHLLSGMTISVGVKNVFNTPPPFDAFNPYFYSYEGDPRMRDFWVSVKRAF